VEEKDRLLGTAGLFALGHCLLASIIFSFKNKSIDLEDYFHIFLGHCVLGGPGLLFRSAGQVRWYRRALVVPWSAAIGSGLLIESSPIEGLAVSLLIAIDLFLFAALLVWVAGAVVVRRRDRILGGGG
jgi:hypothetical protein